MPASPRRVRPLFLLLCAVPLLCLHTPLACRADYFRYTDGQGTVCFTDDYKAIPREFRAGAQRIKEKSAPAQQLQPPPPASQHQSPPSPALAPAPPPPEVTPAPPAALKETLREFWTRTWFRLLAFVAGAGATLVLIARVARHLASPQLVRVIYLAFFLGSFTYAYKLYADYMVQSYFSIKTRAVEMMQQVSRREPESPSDQQ